jgi:hypothetical protein
MTDIPPPSAADKPCEAGNSGATNSAAAPHGWLNPEPTPSRGDAWEPPAKPPFIFATILAYWQNYYKPSFRRGNIIYSDTLDREVKPSEATFGAQEALLDLIAQAADAPRDRKGHIDRDGLPKAFKNWGSSAWAQLLLTLAEEEEAEEVIGTAEEAFRKRVAAALFRPYQLGNKDRDTKERYPEVRTVLDWLFLFADANGGKTWQQVRSLLAWSRKGPDGRVQVALRPDLFAQLNCHELAAMPYRRFAALAERYGVGQRGKACGERVVVLANDYLVSLRTIPADADGEMDGQTAPRARM